MNYTRMREKVMKRIKSILRELRTSSHYALYHSSDLTASELSMLYRKGWELISAYGVKETYRTAYVFKRRIKRNKV